MLAVGVVGRQCLFVDHFVVGKVESLGLPAIGYRRAVLWQPNHTHAVVGICAVSASPCCLKRRSVNNIRQF